MGRGDYGASTEKRKSLFLQRASVLATCRVLKDFQPSPSGFATDGRFISLNFLSSQSSPG